MPAPAYLIGEANSSSGSSLPIPVTTPTSTGDAIAVFARQTSGTVTGVTDSTGNNTYTIQQTNTGNSYNVTTATATGALKWGAAYSTSSYSGITTRQQAANELDTWLNGGTWPTAKLSPRTMGYNILREYYKEGGPWPTSAASDTKNLANAASYGVGNVCITFHGTRDGTNAYTGSTFTSDYSNLVSSISYVKSVFPNAKFTLWHEANLYGANGPFGNGSQSGGSPYGSSVTVAQMHANWQAYVNFYGAAFNAAGVPLYWIPSMASPKEAIDFFDVALNSTQKGWYSGIGCDAYCSDVVNNSGPGGTPGVKTGIDDPYTYGTNGYSMMGLARHYGKTFSIWELGNHGGSTIQPSANMVYFLDHVITPAFSNALANGHPVGEILLFDYGTNAISGSTDPATLAAYQRSYDALNGTTGALGSSATITVTWNAAATVFAAAAGISLKTTGVPDKMATGSGSSTAPSAATAALSTSNEVALAYSVSPNASGQITWGGGWSVLGTDHFGTSTFQSLAYQQVSSSAAVTASGTLGVSGAWDVNVITFPVTTQAVSSGLTVPKPALAGTGNVATPAGGTTGTGGLTVPKPRLSSGGLGVQAIPYVIGDASTSFGTSLTIPITTSVSSGDSVQVGLILASTSSSPTVGPDTAGNVYTLILSSAAHNDSTFVVYQCDGVNPLTAGVDSIPVTQSVSGPFGGFAVGDNAVFAADPAGTVAGAGTSTAPNSGASATLAQVEEHAIAWIANAQAGGIPAWGTGWTALANVDAGSATYISAAYQFRTSTSPVTASGTLSASADWGCGVTTNMATPPAITLTPSNGVAGVPYSQTLEGTATQTPVTWSATGLPPGLSLSAGVISGLPTTAGAYATTLTLTDHLGVAATLSFTLTVLAGASGAAPMGQASNNLFTPADSDFEVAGATWGAWSDNAGPPFTTQAIALTGAGCLGWASLADGPTAIASTSFPVSYPGSYILSGALLPAQNGTAALGITWYDSSGNIVQTDYAPAPIVTGAVWGPLSGAFTVPAGAAGGTAQPVVSVGQSNAGDVNYIDAMFFAQSGAQVLVDWTNPPFGPASQAGNAFHDVSPWLRLDGNGITYTRGRQDAISEIQSASGSFDLQNDQGQFARDNSTSLPAVLGGAMTLKRRVQFNLADEKGVWHTRFDGNISEIDYAFENTGNTSVVTIALTDVLSDLSQQDPLFCWTKQQVLSDGPLYHWSLDDAGTVGGAGIAAETSGNNGPPLRLVSSDSTGTATISWQDSSGGVETLADAASATGQDGSSYWTAGSNQPSSPLRGLDSGHVGPFTSPIGSVLFTPKQTAQSAQNTFVGGTGYQLVTELSSPVTPTATGSDYSVEAWFMPDTSLATGMSLNNGPYIALALGDSRTKASIMAGIWLNAGAAKIECATYNQPPAFSVLNWPSSALPSAASTTSAAWVPDTVKRPHHMVITIQGDPSAASVSLWVDGQQIGSGFTLPKGRTYDTVCIGGAFGGCGAFYGNVSIASIYPYLLSQQQITQHCQMGQYGMWEQTTDDCVAQIAQFATVPGFWSGLTAGHQGLSLTDYLDINGSNALSAMQQYETAEHGLLYADASGALNFHARSWRMGYGAPNLLLPPGTFDAGVSYKIVTQFMCNEEGVAGPNTLGAKATSLLANPATGQTSTQTTSSTVIQAGYVNSASQDAYGVYATSPVSSPLSVPLVTWSRGSAALGLPSYSYWPDPNLSDRAAWDANSRSEPWALPASVTVDLLTLDPATGLTVSDFFALDIDSMIAPSPGTLPPSFPNAQTSVEWFIEGVTETYSLTSHAIEFYTSPAEPQRAWIPGDATYGVLGSTARLGISGADTSTVQADGKDVAHDAGGPYWPPTFTNAPGGFVGAADLRGIAQNLQTMLQPPLCVVAAQSQAQSFNSGSLAGTSPPSTPALYWDFLLADTTGGMGAVPGWPNWYLVTQAGFYEIDVSVQWSVGGAGQGGYCGQAWIAVAQDAAQAIAAGTGTPLTVNQYVCPVGEAVCFTADGINPVSTATTRMYLGVGDMICVAVEHNYTSSKSTSIGPPGSVMSIRFAGIGTVDDRTLINTSLASGGSVSLVSHGALQQATFSNTHTYCYEGTKGTYPNQRRNSDAGAYQGTGLLGFNQGSQVTQIVFNNASLRSALSGHTILSAALTATNVKSNLSTYAVMMLGWTTVTTPGTATYNATKWPGGDVMRQPFQSGQALTFSIPVSIVKALNTGGATALQIGNGTTVYPRFSGEWQGGPGSWTLTVNYV